MTSRFVGSVTRLGYFEIVLVPNFLAKVDQRFGDFGSSFAKCHYFDKICHVYYLAISG